MNTILICPLCKSENVHVKAWVDINTEEVYSVEEDPKDKINYWCNDCENHVIPIEQ